MGSAFYTLDQAMKRLGRSRRSIFNYAEKGFIKKHTDQGKLLFDQEEVDDLAQRLGSDAPAMTRAAWFEMSGRLRKLEDEMTLVKHILGLRDAPPQRPDATTGPSLYKAINLHLLVPIDSLQQYKLEAVAHWAAIFETTDEKTLDLLAQHSGVSTCWYDLFRLCVHLLERCKKMAQEKNSLEWQAMSKRLESALQRLRGVCIIWLESGRGTLPADLLEHLDSKKNVLFRRALAKT